MAGKQVTIVAMENGWELIVPPVYPGGDSKTYVYIDWGHMMEFVEDHIGPPKVDVKSGDLSKTGHPEAVDLHQTPDHHAVPYTFGLKCICGVVGSTKDMVAHYTLHDEKKDTNYPTWVCHGCAIKYGGNAPSMATYHDNICDICGELKSVTEPRDYGYPKFPTKEKKKVTTDHKKEG